MVLAMVVLVAGGCGVEQGEEPIVIEEEGPPYAPEWDGSEALGGDRAARLSLPQDYHVNRQWPLVIALHGYSASPAWIDGFLGVSGQVNEGGFIGLMPPGTVGAGDLSFWNATRSEEHT